MATKEFLHRILPSKGLYVATVFKSGMKAAPTQIIFDTVDELSTALLEADSGGIQVFHACASYSNRQGVFNQRKDKWELRVAENAAWVRSQWLDIDVGEGKDYATRKEALTALKTMCKSVGIPLPLIVKSGPVGLHAYWVFKDDVPAAEAKVGATAFANTMKAEGFRCDTTRTADMASILRPVGSHNRKKDIPTLVEQANDPEPIDHLEFYAKLSSMPASFLSGAIPVIKGLPSTDTWQTETKAFPPSSAKLIAKSCAALREFGMCKGDVAEPHWRAMIGVLKYTTEGGEEADYKLCHSWSKGYDGYSEAETQAKIEGYVKPPTTCEQIERHSGQCASCPHNGSIKSPIKLGYSVEAPPAASEALAKKPRAPAAFNSVEHYSNIEDTDKLPFWPEYYNWNGEVMSHFFKDKDTDISDWVTFGKVFYYPYLRFEGEDGLRYVKISALLEPTRGKWRTFDIPASAIHDPRALAGELAKHEITYMTKDRARNQQYMQDCLAGLQDLGLETETHKTFGWHGDGFVMGNTKIMPKNNLPVFVASDVPHDLQQSLGTKGTAFEWARLIDEIYNREGAEAYQWIICSAIAAPLVKLCETDMWHGIPTALTGPGGLGKTTTCMAACSFYGDPAKMSIQANENGTTMNALYARVGTMHNLPMILDEITGRETKDIQDMLFALSSGRQKLRLSSASKEIDPGDPWATLTFVTGNLNITSMLSGTDFIKAGASQVRVFEIELDEGFNTRVFGGMNAKDLIETQLLSKNYGVAGQEFIRFVLKNKDKVTAQLQKQRASAVASSSTESQERLYRDLIETVMVGAKIAKGMGLISFDLKVLRDWAEGHIHTMRVSREAQASTPEDKFNDYITSLFRHTITTKYYGDNRGGDNRGVAIGDAVSPTQPNNYVGTENVVPPFNEPLARNATEDRVFFSTKSSFKAFAKQAEINDKYLLSELTKLGYVKQIIGEKHDKKWLGKGTTIHTGQCSCIQWDYDKIDGLIPPPVVPAIALVNSES